MKSLSFSEKKSLVRLFLLLIVVWPFVATGFAQQKDAARIRINDRIYCFEVADTLETKQKGLMFREKLDKNSGMLFVYPEEKNLYFYMKNTSIPLDIAFIDKDLKILEIRQMQPFDESIIASRQKAMYALETNRGFFKETGLLVGDKIEFVWKVPGAEE